MSTSTSTSAGSTGSGRRIVLIRHGQTALNQQDRLRGLADPPLDRTGTVQATALIPAMAALQVTAVHASPLRRAVRTGQIIAAALHIACLPDARFTDRDYGDWTGAPRQDVIERFGSVDAAPGVEPTSQVLARVRPALDALLTEHPGTVAIVTHDAVIRPLIAALDPNAAVQASNGSWGELTHTLGGWTVHVVDQLPARSS